MLLSLEIFFQNFCSTSGVPFVMIYMLYRFANGPLEPVIMQNTEKGYLAATQPPIIR